MTIEKLEYICFYFKFLSSSVKRTQFFNVIMIDTMKKYWSIKNVLKNICNGQKWDSDKF